MKKRIITAWVLMFSLILLTSLIFSCGSPNEKSDLEEDVNAETESENKNETSREVITELIGSFSTPVEMALIIKQGNYPFMNSYLLKTENIERFSNNYSKSIAMGAYGANMGYINIYDKSLMAVEYLAVIRTLAKDLDLEHLFDFSKMLELAKKASNVDSLIVISTKNFNDMDLFLREKGRDELSVLMILGTWLEGIHITANLYNANPSEELRNRLAEQKVSFEKLVMILSKAYPNNEFIVDLVGEMKTLTDLFKKINIEYIYREPIMTEVNGELVIEDQSEMKIMAEDEDLNKIANNIIELRNKLLN